MELLSPFALKTNALKICTPLIKLMPVGCGARKLMVLPSAEAISLTTASPILTRLPLPTNLLPRTVITLPAETKAAGYMSAIETGVGRCAVRVNGMDGEKTPPALINSR